MFCVILIVFGSYEYCGVMECGCGTFDRCQCCGVVCCVFVGEVGEGLYWFDGG